MRSILEILYNDSLENGKVLNGNKEYEKHYKEFNGLYNELNSELTEVQRKKLTGMCNAEVDLEDEASCAYFKEGFKVCLLILAELCKS